MSIIEFEIRAKTEHVAHMVRNAGLEMHWRLAKHLPGREAAREIIRLTLMVETSVPPVSRNSSWNTEATRNGMMMVAVDDAEQSRAAEPSSASRQVMTNLRS